jgi:tetratricopeptide (TPR) repeat protein
MNRVEEEVSMMQQLLWRCSVLLAVTIGLVAAEARDVRAWEDTITIPTYRLGPEDVNPRFYELEGAIYYPYTAQDHLTTIKEDKTYKALYLENEYLKLICLPDLGGKIYSVLDKTTNEEMFYRNHVIKPGLIAMRGAWISGGIEWNAGPTGHGVASYSPVDATYVKQKDGSAMLVIGDTEQSTRTRWTVWLTLHPGKSYLDQRIRIENPTDTVQTFYFWNNTAFPCREGTRFIYPMTLGTDHAGTNFFSWPIDNGKDLTWLKNYDRPTSVFAYQCAFDFFGAYDVDADRGIVQVANHHELIGKKAWTWGNSDDGLVSQSRLTDDDGPYIEVQSGPLETQADFGLLGPQQSIEWQEWWYPVHGLGQGFEYATKDVAVQTVWTKDNGDNRLEIRMLPTSAHRKVTCRVTPPALEIDGEAEITMDYIEIARVGPEEPFVIQLNLGADISAEIEIFDRYGRTLARFATPLPIPMMNPPEPAQPADATGAEALVLAGIAAEKETKRTAAREKYEAALAQDAGHTEALVRLAVLDIEAAQYEAARARVDKALERNPGHGMAWYYGGVAWLGEDWLRGGDTACLDEALQSAHQAAQSLDTAALGHDLLGRVYMRQGKHADALRAFNAAMARTSDNPIARTHRMLAHYALGDGDMALAEAEQLLDRDPLAVLPRVVQADSGKTSWNAAVKVILANAGEDEFIVLEAAYELAALGALRLAPNLLTHAIEAHDSSLASRPLPYYVLAYLQHRAGDAGGASLQLPRVRHADYVFPSRPESLPVLRYVCVQTPGDAKAHLYLGNLYAGLGRLDEAVPAWQEAVRLDDKLSVAHRNLAMHAWKKDTDLAQAATHFEKALAARPDDQILYRDLANVLIAQEKRPEAIALVERAPESPSRRGDLMTLLAQAHLDSGNYDATLASLEKRNFSNWEGNATSWRIYHQAHLARGKERLESGDHRGALDDFEASLDYPENLGVGRAVDPEEAESYYWKGQALEALNRTEKARRAWQTAAGGKEGSTGQNEHRQKASDALAAH